MLPELLPLTTNELVLCIVIIFIAYVIKGLSGFGSGLVAIPLLAFFFTTSVYCSCFGFGKLYRHGVSKFYLS